MSMRRTLEIRDQYIHDEPIKVCEIKDMKDRLYKLEILLPSHNLSSLQKIAETGCTGPTELLLQLLVGHNYPSYEVNRDAAAQATNVCQITNIQERTAKLKTLILSKDSVSLKKLAETGCSGPTKLLTQYITKDYFNAREKLVISTSPPEVRSILEMSFGEMAVVFIGFMFVTSVISLIWRRITT